MATPERPHIGRRVSRVPGGFDTDEDLSPIKTEFDYDDWDHSIGDETPSRPVKQPDGDQTAQGEGSLNTVGEDDRNHSINEGNTVDEKEIRRKLMDMDSSFLPDLSPATDAQSVGIDDTYVVGTGHPQSTADESRDKITRPNSPTVAREGQLDEESPATPPETYQTPAPGRRDLPHQTINEEGNDSSFYNTSSLETMSSSPTAAAAARTISRAVSMASMEGYETADDTQDSGVPLQHAKQMQFADLDSTPKKGAVGDLSLSKEDSPTPTKPVAAQGNEGTANQDNEKAGASSPRSRRRPSYLSSRRSSQRLSYSSYTTNSTDGGSDLTLGADYALQSGGSVPYGSSLSSRPSLMSRGTSLGSMASGVTNLSEGDDKAGPVGSAADELATLDEEEDSPVRHSTRDESKYYQPPETPKATTKLHTPTETVIAQHVRDVEVPATMAREFHDRYRSGSPDKRNSGSTISASRNGKSMTLKEQSNTIDKYMKLNWDLQLKITFLNQALNQRSDEGVKAMISENVELNTARVNLAKEIRELKRSIRTLERDIEKKDDELARMAKAAKDAESLAGPNSEELQDIENEVTYLRERVTTYEVNFEKMRHDSIRQEGEKRRMAEILKTVSRRGGSDVGVREELDYYRDELEAETARREEADEENRKLREEIWHLQGDNMSINHTHTTSAYHMTQGHRVSSKISHDTRSDHGLDDYVTASATSSTLVEQLRHENAKLQRDMRAQESMLTSRNKEKEHLYQEIEELKLAARRSDGTKSIAGDSIFERSISRAHRRPTSRASEAPPTIHLTDAERDALETKNGELRDQINELKLENQDMTRQLELCLDELSQLDVLRADHDKLQQAYDNELGVATEDLQSLQAERDEALHIQEQLDAELENQRNRFEDLQSEAAERIDSLDDELDQKARHVEQMQQEISNQTDQAEALRSEVRSLSERIVRIGDDMSAKAKRIDELEIEVEAVTNETDEIHKDRAELRNQHERLTVQYESSQNQIAFLREEQDGDKIKIGDLENALNGVQANLNNEKERAKELDHRLAEERHQREVIGSKEKQEVQKIINDLNREASGAKDEARQLKTSLQSNEIELTTWKERLLELESHLRETLGDSNGTRSTFLTSITRIQKELEATSSELENTRHNLSEKERLLRNRDSLLESHGLESKKLADLLERERQGRRADKAQHEQWQRTHQHTSRTVSQKDTRIVELETAKQSDRKKLQALESQLKGQLQERNSLLLSLWARLSATCGSDWQHQNSLISGHVPTLEVVSSMLPAFSKTLLLAVSHIENIITSFKARIRTIERDLSRQYQTLESSLDERTKKLEKLESSVQSSRVQGTFSAAPEIAKLKGENRLLKSEIAVLQKQESHAKHTHRVTSSRELTPLSANANDSSAPPPTLARHHSSSAVERGSTSSQQRSSSRTPSLVPLPIPERSEEQSVTVWKHRLRELERRLKAEREARLLDRTGARKRLEAGLRENEDLRAELEREKERSRRGR